ncbi:MAG: hypothetical protein M1821_002552 [Bathelium mastoideum]|nr:MAG: hypothetical protein M1821_002552 [Bathelium mastoideum]
MIDPITITTGIGALLTTTYSIVVELKAFGDGVAIVKDKLNGLLQDVEAFKLVLKSMSDTFGGIKLETDSGDVGKHWQNIDRALQNGQETLDQLRGCLKDINTSSRLLDDPKKQLRLQLAGDRLSLFRQHVQSYSDALQLSIQTVILSTQVSQKHTTDQILPRIGDLHDELRRVANLLNQRIESLHGMIASQGPKIKSHRDSQWEDESQMVAMCILRDCIHSAATVVSSASSRLSTESGVDPSIIAAASSDIDDYLPRRSLVMLQRYVDSRAPQESTREGSSADVRFITSAQAIHSELTDYPDSDDDLESDIITTLVHMARKILRGSGKERDERLKAERCLHSCLTRLSYSSATAQGDKAVTYQWLETEALDLLVSIYCDNSQWVDARSVLLKKMAVKERLCSADDSSLLADVLLLARVLLASQEYLEAHLHARRALKAYRRTSDAEGCSESLQVLIRICRASNKDDDAEAYEALLTELYPDNGYQSNSNEAPKPGTPINAHHTNTNPIASSSDDKSGPTKGKASLSKRAPLDLSYDRQHNLSDVIASAKIAAKLASSDRRINRSRKPKPIPRGASEREPIIQLPPSPVEEQIPGKQDEKPKFVPRGADERLPTIELPPFPAGERPRLVPRGADERASILELPPFPEKDKLLPWDTTRLWPRRKRSTKVAERKPYMPIETKLTTIQEKDPHLSNNVEEPTPAPLERTRTKIVDILTKRASQSMIPIEMKRSSYHEVHVERSSPAIRKSQTKSADILNARAPRYVIGNADPPEHPSLYIERPLPPVPKPERSSSSTALGKPGPSSKVRFKPTLSRSDITSMLTILDDQWFRKNRSWLIEMLSYTETDALPRSASASTSDLLADASGSSHSIERKPSYETSIASSDTPTLSMSMLHPALRPEHFSEMWI